MIHNIIDQTSLRFQLLEANRLIKPVDARPPQKESISSPLSCSRSFHISSTCSVCVAMSAHPFVIATQVVSVTGCSAIGLFRYI